MESIFLDLRKELTSLDGVEFVLELMTDWSVQIRIVDLVLLPGHDYFHL